MDYKKKYTDLIERLHKAMDDDSVNDERYCCVIKDIVPELEEPEDEKIRKAIVDVFKTHCDYEVYFGVSVTDILAWLEKKGEQKSTLPKWKYKKDNTPLLRDSLILNKYGCVAKSPSGAIVSDVWVVDYDELAKLPKEESEKQGEQKPVDKVEPKFHEGEWIVFNGLTLYVNEVVLGYYRTISINGIPNSYDWDIDNVARLWTIQEAKNGDLLADNYGIYIFDRFDEYDERCYLCRGAYQYSQKEYENEHMLCSVEVHPVTKEQRDLLFQKMKEAGYEWDAEKKELRKIEQKPADKDERKGMNIVEEDMTPFQKKVFCIIDTTIEEEQGLKQVCDELLRLAHDEIMQKPAEWNKEDIFTLDFLVDYLSRIIVNASPEEYIDGLARSVTLLKAIKDGIIARPHWKPTEEQMKCLSQVKGTDDHVGYVLCTLYNDLKKLTE